MLKYIYVCLLCLIYNIVSAQWLLEGRVVNSKDDLIKGATIQVKRHKIAILTDQMGVFMVTVNQGDTILISCIGYRTQEIYLNHVQKKMTFILASDVKELEEATVSTGYYNIPRERSAGSFGVITKKEIERGISSSILERLEGMTSGLSLDRLYIEGEERKQTSDFQIRGLSTIESNARPLIILDDVPYGGELNTIDPNTIENITVLKDATAASIWGARAGNGVLVINTKKGKFNQPVKISLRSSTELGKKPDLYYDKKFLPAEIVMGFEKEMFQNKSYPERNQTVIPLYVEYLIANRDKSLTDDELFTKELFLKNQDIRRNALEKLYQNSVNQQYALSITGGNKQYNYAINGGFDTNKQTLIGNRQTRKSINLNNTLHLWSSGELATNIGYTRTDLQNNAVSYSELSIPTYRISPYLYLMDQEGNSASIPYGYRSLYQDKAQEMGLLDWHYRPVDELLLNNNNTANQEIRFSLSLKQKILSGLNMRLLYNYRRSNQEGTEYAKRDSYAARNVINRFTQSNGERIIPLGGIMTSSGRQLSYDNIGRFQLDYEWSSKENHKLYALAGAEIREAILRLDPLTRLYGYDENLKIGISRLNYAQRYSTRPTGSANIDLPVGDYGMNTDRYLSYFANSSYSYKNRYVLSSSIRWDGSNIYGVKANQKGIPLWSLGGAWEISKEPFFKFAVFDYLRLRSTFGSSGNSNSSVSAYPIVLYGTDVVTGLRSARLKNPGNPYLKWEKVTTTNIGLDFRLLGGRISGNAEFYVKNSNDLIGEEYLDPTYGLSPGFLPSLTNKVNYASLRTQGWDVELRTENLKGKLKWTTNYIFSFVKDKVTKYVPSTLSETQDISTFFYNRSRPPVQLGKSLNTLYSFPWYGLDASGLPFAFSDGDLVENYQTYHNNFPVDKLINSGVTVAPYFGSLRNEFSWGNIDLSFLILWKAGHVLRRTSMSSGDEYRYKYHTDYFRRWQKSGDELHTNVPAATLLSQVNDVQIGAKNLLYENSETLVTPASFVRLQDVTVGYNLYPKKSKTLVKGLKVFLQLKNLGIIWRKNKEGIDPEYPSALYPVPFSSALGMNIDF
ncbi:SusC/RagA family TonB-linked outer membrane protein [Sphingobacterium siyangense]